MRGPAAGQYGRVEMASRKISPIAAGSALTPNTCPPVTCDDLAEVLGAEAVADAQRDHLDLPLRVGSAEPALWISSSRGIAAGAVVATVGHDHHVVQPAGIPALLHLLVGGEDGLVEAGAAGRRPDRGQRGEVGQPVGTQRGDRHQLAVGLAATEVAAEDPQPDRPGVTEQLQAAGGGRDGHPTAPLRPVAVGTRVAIELETSIAVRIRWGRLGDGGPHRQGLIDHPRIDRARGGGRSRGGTGRGGEARPRRCRPPRAARRRPAAAGTRPRSAPTEGFVRAQRPRCGAGRAAARTEGRGAARRHRRAAPPAVPAAALASYPITACSVSGATDSPRAIVVTSPARGNWESRSARRVEWPMARVRIPPITAAPGSARRRPPSAAPAGR